MPWSFACRHVSPSPNPSHGSIKAYRFRGVLLADGSFRIVVLVVVVARIRLLTLGGELVGYGAVVLWFG